MASASRQEIEAATREIEEAVRDMCVDYDPTDPSNLVGMLLPSEGELREIVEAEMVDGQVMARLAPQKLDVITVTITKVLA